MSREPALEGFYEALLDDDAEALYERAPCGYLSTTPDGLIVKVNQTFLSWTGYERTDLVGKRLFVELLSAGGRIYHETHFAPLLHMQSRVREIALDLHTAGGELLPVLVNAILERDDEGRPRVVRIAVFDATERREYERELLRAKERAEASEAHAKLLARTLQHTLIPPTPPAIPGLDLAAVYRPAGTGEEIGGDFYDVFQIGVGDWVLAVGDVRGKGVDAAVVTALARYTIRAAAVEHPCPSAVLATLNSVLMLDGTDRFCTAALVRLRRSDGGWSATVCAGGHPLPLLLRNRAVREVGIPGSLLGAFDEITVHDEEVDLLPGDSLVLYTDGVTEGRRGDGGDWFGEQRLTEAILIHRESPGSIAAGVLGEVLYFQADHPRDDIVVVAVRVPER